MLDSLRRKEPLYDDEKITRIRDNTSYEYSHELLNLYHPEEDIDSPGSERASRE